MTCTWYAAILLYGGGHVYPRPGNFSHDSDSRQLRAEFAHYDLFVRANTCRSNWGQLHRFSA